MKANLFRSFRSFPFISIENLFLIFPLCGILLSVAYIWRPYSFWLDELISVTTSQLDPSEMFVAILEDVHPPLYQLLLWIWIRILGDSEFAIRALSLGFSLLSLVYLAVWAKKFNVITRIGILTFFSSSFLFAYYAQEARSYAMLLLLSTIITTRFLDFDSKQTKLTKIAAISLMASLTHYFGLLLSAVILAWLFLDNRKNLPRLMRIAVISMVLLIWPIIQYHYGDIGSKTGGNFWIKVEGPLGTLSVIREALWPTQPLTSMGGLAKFASIPITFAALALLLLFLVLWLKKNDGGFEIHKNHFARLAFLIGGVTILTTLIDMHTPISTIRNYIILLPASAIFFGLVVSWLYRFPGMPVICALFLLASGAMRLSGSYNAMTNNKWCARENWKEASAYLIHNSNEYFNYYYLPFNESESEYPTLQRVYNFYVKKLSDGKITLTKIKSSETEKLRKPFAILFGHVGPDYIKREVAVDPNYGSFIVFYPAQCFKKSTGVILSVAPYTAISNYGVRRHVCA